jgi:hypothetical protein
MTFAFFCRDAIRCVVTFWTRRTRLSPCLTRAFMKHSAYIYLYFSIILVVHRRGTRKSRALFLEI